MKPKTFSDFDDEVLSLNCFFLDMRDGKPITYKLALTHYYFHLKVIKRELQIYWYEDDTPVSFETVLENTPAEIQYKLLSGLGLFKQFTQLE